jgi:rhamnosyltransferase
MKIAGVVILYNPDDNVISNISSYIDEIDKLYIFDNSVNKQIEFPDTILNKSIYIHSGENEGIAKRLNQALYMAYNDGFELLLTMDQDSSFFVNDCQKYFNQIDKFNLPNSNISMVGLRHFENITNNYTLKSQNAVLITSGSIINLKISIQIGGFDETLFIDYVDTEFCIRSFKNNFNTIMIMEICLKHNEGIKKYINFMCILSGTRMVHNPLRIFFKIRNYIFLTKKYPNYKEYFPLKDIANVIKNNLLYSNNKFKSLYYFFKGIIAGIKI